MLYVLVLEHVVRPNAHLCALLKTTFLKDNDKDSVADQAAGGRLELGGYGSYLNTSLKRTDTQTFSCNLSSVGRCASRSVRIRPSSVAFVSNVVQRLLYVGYIDNQFEPKNHAVPGARRWSSGLSDQRPNRSCRLLD